MKKILLLVLWHKLFHILFFITKLAGRERCEWHYMRAQTSIYGAFDGHTYILKRTWVVGKGSPGCQGQEKKASRKKLHGVRDRRSRFWSFGLFPAQTLLKRGVGWFCLLIRSLFIDECAWPSPLSFWTSCIAHYQVLLKVVFPTLMQNMNRSVPTTIMWQLPSFPLLLLKEFTLFIVKMALIVL